MPELDYPTYSEPFRETMRLNNHPHGQSSAGKGMMQQYSLMEPKLIDASKRNLLNANNRFTDESNFSKETISAPDIGNVDKMQTNFLGSL